MRPDDRDLAYLWDIRHAADSIRRFTEAVSLDEFRTNELVRSAVERQLILIGEAARRVSDAFREAHQGLPWREMIGQRNVLVHEYGEVSDELIWRVITDDLPRLIQQIQSVLPPDGPSTGQL